MAWIAELAAEGAPIVGVVAFAPLESLEASLPLLDQYADDPLVVGVRRNIQGEPRGFAQSLAAGVREVAVRGLTFDLCVTADQLGDAAALVEAVPEGRFVLDHLGKPKVGRTPMDVWQSDVARLAERGTWCKLSGLTTEAPPGTDHGEFDGIVGHALDVFGPDRIMFGSDWPVCTLATDYQAWLGSATERWVPAQHRTPVFCTNVVDFYGLPRWRPATSR